MPPRAAPIINKGARTPPDVPEPSEIIQIADLTIRTPATILSGASPWRSIPIVSYPTPKACGKTNPPNPTNTPPIAGHHIQ